MSKYHRIWFIVVTIIFKGIYDIKALTGLEGEKAA